MFLANTGNIVQALDARTGELIWENRIGPDISGGLGAIRSLALYQDKVYLATTDVRLVALDARTGKQAWETRIADTAKGYSNTSGHIVVNGKVRSSCMGGCDRYKEMAGCYISAYDAQTGEANLEIRDRRSHQTPRTAKPGATYPISCAPAATPGSPAVTIPISTLPIGASRKRNLGCAPSAAPTPRRSTLLPHSRSIRIPESSTGISNTSPASRSISTPSTNACSWTAAAKTLLFPPSAKTDFPLETRPQVRQIPGLQIDRVPERF